jgi:hypothetical protein
VPACVTASVRPAIVTVPVRELDAGLGVTASVTVPLPVPALPAVMVIHGALLTAVHEHPTPPVTVTEAVPAVDASESVAGESV